jgi:hypothetical protein
MSTKHTSEIAILAIGILAAPSLMATSFTAANGDLLLGFRQSGNNTSDYLIDLTKLDASWTSFNLRDATTPLVLNLGPSLLTDFTTAFGSSGPAGLLWGIVASNGNAAANSDPFRTYYLTEPTGSEPLTTTAQSTQINAIAGVAGQYGPLTSGAITGGTILTDGSNGLTSYTNSWTTRVTGTFGNAQLAPIEAAFGTNLDFWRMPQGAAGLQSNEGTFSFSGTTLTFTPTPEPGSALLLGLSALGVAGFRRRRSA